MRIGSLNKWVTLQRPADGRNTDTGAIVRRWEDVASLWANIRFLNGSETLKSATPVSAARASIRIRQRADVCSDWRVVHGTTVFNILAVLPDAQGNEHVDLACDTGANDG
jgi:SPP1 family predicted phage head-tail adaptor